jgi:protein-tyrosine phosphatase
LRPDLDLIIQNLYQGAAPPFGETVAKLGFDTLVLCAKENQRDDLYPGVEVVLAPGDDDCRVNRMMRDLPIWQQAAQIVVERVNAGKKVLVTCMAGLNRSGMVTALALRQLTNWTGAEIVEHIQASREMALCNDTFAEYIRGLPVPDVDG